MGGGRKREGEVEKGVEGSEILYNDDPERSRADRGEQTSENGERSRRLRLVEGENDFH